MKPVKVYSFLTFKNQEEKEQNLAATWDMLTEDQLEESINNNPLHDCYHATFDELEEYQGVTAHEIKGVLLETNDYLCIWDEKKRIFDNDPTSSCGGYVKVN